MTLKKSAFIGVPIQESQAMLFSVHVDTTPSSTTLRSSLRQSTGEHAKYRLWRLNFNVGLGHEAFIIKTKIMNEDIQNLGKFIQIYNNLKQNEDFYLSLEDYQVSNYSSYFFDSFLYLNENLEKVVKLENLTEKKLEKYRQLNDQIYRRLKLDYPQLYSIGRNISEIFHLSYEAAEKSISDYLAQFTGKPRPFLACGFSFFEIYVSEHSFINFMLKDQLIELDNFSLSNNCIILNTIELNEKYKLTEQEYEIYEKAYSACLDVLHTKLGLKGRINCYID
jgi:hypothetical protein